MECLFLLRMFFPAWRRHFFPSFLHSHCSTDEHIKGSTDSCLCKGFYVTSIQQTTKYIRAPHVHRHPSSCRNPWLLVILPCVWRVWQFTFPKHGTTWHHNSKTEEIRGLSWWHCTCSLIWHSFGRNVSWSATLIDHTNPAITIQHPSFIAAQYLITMSCFRTCLTVCPCLRQRFGNCARRRDEVVPVFFFVQKQESWLIEGRRIQA